MQYPIIWTSEIQYLWIAKVDNNFVHGLCFVYHILSNWFADITFCFHKTHLYVQNTCIKIFLKFYYKLLIIELPKVKYNSKTKWKMQYPGQCKSRKIVWWLQIWFTLLTVLDLFPKHHPWSLTPHDFHICSILAKARTAMHCTQQLQNVQWKSSFQNHKQALRATPPAFVLAHALSNKYLTYHKLLF